MTLADNDLGFFQAPFLLWEQFPASFLEACCQGLSGSRTGHRFPFLSCVPAFSGSVSVVSSSPLAFKQMTQQCLPIIAVLKVTVISKFDCRSGNLIFRSDFQI